MKQHIKDQKLVFNAPTEELREAIMERLDQLGVPEQEHHYTAGADNISVNKDMPGYRIGNAFQRRASLSGFFKGFRVTTLDELYMLDRWLPHYAIQMKVGNSYLTNDGHIVRCDEYNERNGNYHCVGHPDWAPTSGWMHPNGAYVHCGSDYKYAIKRTVDAPKRTIQIDGKTIKLSEESYQAFRKQLFD